MAESPLNHQNANYGCSLSGGEGQGGRVFLFLHTDDFWRDHRDLTPRGVRFVRPPKEESYGTVAAFEDLYGNLWDLLQLRDAVRPNPIKSEE